VNQPHGERPHLVDPVDKLPAVDLGTPPPDGSRQRLLELGPEAFAARAAGPDGAGGHRHHLPRRPPVAAGHPGAHQGPARRRRARRPHHPAAAVSLECWGGATYDVALRFLHEDPWDRLAALREAVPNVCLQMLLRGRNTVGYTPYPEQVTTTFVREAAATGIDVFRIFDALNDVAQMRPAIDAVRATGTAVGGGGAVLHRRPVRPGEDLYTLDYYLRLAEQIVAAGAHVLAIKDMAGLLRPPAAATLVTRCGSASTPRCTCTPTTPPAASWPPCWPPGPPGWTRWTARSPRWPAPPASRRCRRSSRPPTPPSGPPAWSWPRSTTWSPTGRRCAGCTRPFESGLAAPTGRVYTHEIPGGQLSNLRQQAIALGLGQRFEEVEDAYAAADRLLGRLVKVTPSSKVVGDLALQLVGSGVSVEDFAAEPARSTCPTR
jgi:pyruvate carboxylase